MAWTLRILHQDSTLTLLKEYSKNNKSQDIKE
jgi:hypothetical protein